MLKETIDSAPFQNLEFSFSSLYVMSLHSFSNSGLPAVFSVKTSLKPRSRINYSLARVPSSLYLIITLCYHNNDILLSLSYSELFNSNMVSISRLVSSVAQSCLTLCDPMDYSMPGLPVHHQLPELTQTHVH